MNEPSTGSEGLQSITSGCNWQRLSNQKAQRAWSEPFAMPLVSWLGTPAIRGSKIRVSTTARVGKGPRQKHHGWRQHQDRPGCSLNSVLRATHDQHYYCFLHGLEKQTRSELSSLTISKRTSQTSFKVNLVGIIRSISSLTSHRPGFRNSNSLFVIRVLSYLRICVDPRPPCVQADRSNTSRHFSLSLPLRTKQPSLQAAVTKQSLGTG